MEATKPPVITPTVIPPVMTQKELNISRANKLLYQMLDNINNSQVSSVTIGNQYYGKSSQ